MIARNLGICKVSQYCHQKILKYQMVDMALELIFIVRGMNYECTL